MMGAPWGQVCRRRLVQALLLVSLALCLQLCTAQPRFHHRGGGGHHGGHNHHEEETGLGFDPYEALEVPRDASQSDIRRAFRRLSLELHPDKNPGHEERFNRVNQAYEVLGDEDKRRIYDDYGDREFHSQWEFERSGGAHRHGGARDFYENSAVKRLSSRAFNMKRTKPLLVEFYAPWCVHCQQMTTVWKQVALMLEGEVNVGAVNCDKNENLCYQLGIQGYPTLRLYMPDSNSPEPYDGPHTVEDITAFIQAATSNVVVDLTPGEFQKQVMQDHDHMWLIDFAAPWCGPCNALKPMLREFATSMGHLVKVGAVDCDRWGHFCAQQQAQYYPFLKLYPAGDKHKLNDGIGEALPYDTGHGLPSATALELTTAVLKVAFATGLPTGMREIEQANADELGFEEL